MTTEEKFDAIVVGAGPAGSACAYVLAREGKSVLLIERGASSGSKNVTGGRIYTYALEMVEPGLYERAPLQRKVVREQMMLLGRNGAATLDYVDYDFGEGVPQSYTILRAPFDEWFASEAEGQGALVATGILVDGLIEENGKIVGIKAGEDEMYADIVIAADGVNSFIAQKAGLFGDISAKTVSVGIKEIIELPENIIETRFNLRGNEGAARLAIGCTAGISGGAFLYTNKESISLGIVFNPEQAGKSGKRIHQILQDFKMHPAILTLIEGGTTVEYGAHLVPEVGLTGVPQKLYRDGLIVVGDAAGFVINTGTIIRGIDLAIVSGLAAANAVLKASEPSQIGRLYMQELQNLLLLPTMKVFAGWHNILGIPRMVKEYPDLVNEAMNFMFTVDGKVPEKMPKAMLSIIKKHVSFFQLVTDGWTGLRSI
ncbi:FAD-dependent oxidoreductase [Sporomusa sp. KB1]|jgi:electron transfer flavoprotein-quinone oxidoreductase|uniref:FAD-dependent oxidoreductase n=1 Tax=Sporomusa sp. KB1 TaxID=943346 RepID=UPI0011AA56F8|nr:FAD-dependent oxidoreductase [Sporomusa sp. KB1]TWH46748.1 electron transfer flavoprotein-quinone oxidoreductase [Sporomusa sp. KB1]